VINCPKMPSFKFVIFLSSLLVISLLSLSSGNEAAPTYMYHYCSAPWENFTANSTFQSNLDLVLSSLSSNATFVTGFSNASTGVVSGLFLCRGDVSATVCQDCVAYGAKEILQRCILLMGAIVWYDECMVRYTNYLPFFATLNEGPDKNWGSTLTTPERDKDRFNELLGRTMDSLATRASNSLTGKKFATVEEEFNSSLIGSQTLYSLVQCTPDLTVSDCNKCLRGARMQLPTCCDGKQGGWVLRPSCILRYGLDKFYNSTAVSEPAAFPPAPGMKRDCDRLNI
jgi:hypothetical protein